MELCADASEKTDDCEDADEMIEDAYASSDPWVGPDPLES